MGKEYRSKESAFSEYITVIKQSWTWDRLTEQERERCMNAMNWVRDQNILRGNFEARWDILQAVYSAFLDGVGYKPIGWREDSENPAPQF